MKSNHLLPILITILALASPMAGQAPEPETFFHNFVGLSNDQVRDIGAGKAIAKVLDTPTPDEVFVFGAVYINSTPERYLQMASDIDALRKIPNYLALRKFSDPPSSRTLLDSHLTIRRSKNLSTANRATARCSCQL